MSDLREPEGEDFTCIGDHQRLGRFMYWSGKNWYVKCEFGGKSVGAGSTPEMALADLRKERGDSSFIAPTQPEEQSE